MRKTHSMLMVAAVFHRAPDERHYGFEITARSGIKSGVLYPILRRMVAAGWLSSWWEDPEMIGGRPPRRYYRLTESGREQVADCLTAAKADARFAGMEL